MDAVVTSPWCCPAMTDHASHTCPDQDDPFDCPDRVIAGEPGRWVGFSIHDGGSSTIRIAFCPWCGSAQPEE
jgi:hypothetical protein